MTVIPSFHPVGLDRDALREQMRGGGFAGLLLTSPENVFYTTGYTSLPSAGNPILYTLRGRMPYSVAIDREGRTTLLCWGFSAQDVDFGADRIVGFNNYAGALERLREVLRDCLPEGGRLGVEDSCPRFVLELLAEADGRHPELVSAEGVLAALRLVKSPAELALVRRSTEIIEQTASELFPLLRCGMSRREIMLEARSRLLRNGATGISHLTFSFGNSNPEVEADEPLEPGSLVTLDLGGIYEGYCSDNRRYAYVGDAPDSLVEHYRTMVAIVDAVGAALVPGTPYREAFDTGVRLFAENGIPLLDRFTHVGHNIGLETEEEWLGDDPDSVVRAGMAINIELYSQAPTGEMIGNEETYLIHDDGPERISVLPREIYRVDTATA
jgi:Xaa-Pro aminopeptidase